MFISSCSQEKDIALHFNALVHGEPLEFGKNYPAPNGDGTFIINDFKLYVSNVQLINSSNSDNNHIEKDSYHLLKFQDANADSILIDSVAISEYDKIRISVGVDEEGNLSKKYPGDLDPTNQMAWNWTVGYKFVLFEGLYSPESSENEMPLVFHIGFSENKRDLEFDLDSESDLSFNIEVMEMFQNPELIDWNELPSVLFNKEHSAMVANNYGRDFIKKADN